MLSPKSMKVVNQLHRNNTRGVRKTQFANKSRPQHTWDICHWTLRNQQSINQSNNSAFCCYLQELSWTNDDE